MSVSILYHCFGLSKIKYVKTEFQHGRIIFWVHLKEKVCSRCHSMHVIQKGRKYRMLRTVPIGNRAVFIRLEIRRLYCHDCGAIAQESIEQIAAFKKHYTKKLEQYIHTLSSMMTIQDIADFLKMHWNTLWDIVSLQLEKYVPRARDLRKLHWIGIDEVSYKKGHKYLTVVIDHLTGRVVHVAKGRGEQSISSFFKRLKRLKAPLEVVTCDMWQPYLTVINTFFPDTHIVYDKFHIVNNLNKRIDELRRQEFHLNKKMDPQISKGTRFLLLKRSYHLGTEAKEKLEQLFRINKTLATAYELKEMLFQLWECRDVFSAQLFLHSWCKMVYESLIRPLMKYANLLITHEAAILNYFKYPLTNARTEGIINKIKTLKKQAYGFRNMNNFLLKIYSIHKSRYALIG